MTKERKLRNQLAQINGLINKLTREIAELSQPQLALGEDPCALRAEKHRRLAGLQGARESLIDKLRELR